MKKSSFDLEHFRVDKPVAISGNSVSDYTFLGAILCYTMEVAGKKFNAELQNGQYYYNLDYSQPSNLPELYNNEGTDEIFFKLDDFLSKELSESDFKKESKHYDYVCETAKEFEMSVDELAEAYDTYLDILEDAEAIVLSLIKDFHENKWTGDADDVSW